MGNTVPELQTFYDTSVNREAKESCYYASSTKSVTPIFQNAQGISQRWLLSEVLQGERREGVNASVTTDVQAVFKGKTYNQLQVIFQGIESKIRKGGPNLDIGYWESLLQQLRAYMARARLRERHQDVLRQKLFKLKQEQGVESEPLFPIIKQNIPNG
ncbi:splicing factor Cactin-like [Pelobates fuscus]|uniref:splicing factor Cactin-like n=1 Tax=Pelobates fuscus TaxID=191477 RepID=UPI002FE4F633